jgi:moderate conductance mechanosensitive channel
MMSSLFTQWSNFTIPGLHLLEIFLLALLVNYFLGRAAAALVIPASSQSKAALAHHEQTERLANGLFSAGRKIVWCLALLTALPEFGISPVPAVAVIGLAMLGLGFGARNFTRDLIAGFQIVFEDQYAVGDTIRTLQAAGKVEYFTLRRTVLRDLRGAVVTLANGDIGAVGNLSRDWSQAFVDISVGSEEPLERTLQALETASATLRSDPSWSQAIVDGPRVLGVHSYGRMGPTLRLQVRTAPTRQDEVSRELRRRIQIEFQRQHIVICSAQDATQPTVLREPKEKIQA